MGDNGTSRSDPVAWDVALGVARQAIRLAGEPLDEADLFSLQAEFSDVTRRAETLVERATGLHGDGPTRALVTGRAGWAEANVGSFRRLLRPVGERLAASAKTRRALNPANKIAAGVEVGLVLGWMSGRVLGQYDLFPGDEASGDAVYYVAPNILALEREHDFDPAEFRLWIALHEVTHRLQFTGVPWMRAYFLALVERGTELASPDVSALLASLRRAAAQIRDGRNPLAEGGIVTLLASSEQLETLNEAQALMSLLEGHGDVIMSRAGRDEISQADHFASVLHARRSSTKGVTKVIQQVLGLEAKMRQYAQGEFFVEAVLEAGGDELFACIWREAAMLPTLEEVRDPALWIARVGGRAAATA